MGLEWQRQTRMAGSGEWRCTSVRVVSVASREIECGIDSRYYVLSNSGHGEVSERNVLGANLSMKRGFEVKSGSDGVVETSVERREDGVSLVIETCHTKTETKRVTDSGGFLE